MNDDTTRFNRFNGPSDWWFRQFVQRHPEIKQSRPTSQDTQRVEARQVQIVDDYFTKLGI